MNNIELTIILNYVPVSQDGKLFKLFQKLYSHQQYTIVNEYNEQVKVKVFDNTVIQW